MKLFKTLHSVTQCHKVRIEEKKFVCYNRHPPTGQSVETMPWYNENFDSDLEMELDERKIIANGGKKFLDLGTGPATQEKHRRSDQLHRLA
jgi:hypothetical protein